jgi:hypothetical protein
MKRPILILIGLALAVYVWSYTVFRQSRTEVWQRDGLPYVIFPEGDRLVYYLFRPLTYLDGALTGMRFHIGSHPDPSAGEPLD